MRATWLVLLLLAAGQAVLSAEPLPYLELVKSQPVEVNGLEFVVATQSQWAGRAGGTIWPIEFQLLITNKSGGDLVFRTFDTFAPKIKNADGTKVRCGGERDGTIASPSVLIRAGDTYCLSRMAETVVENPRTASLGVESRQSHRWLWLESRRAMRPPLLGWHRHGRLVRTA